MDFDGMELSPALEQLYGTPAPTGASLRKLAGDASTRTYYRLTVPHPPAGTPPSLIVMRLPEDPLGSDEGTGDAPAPTELPFLAVGRLLAGRGVPVPRVWAADLPHGLLLLEDLGDETFERRLHRTAPEHWEASYAQAVDLLADLHTRCDPPEDGSLPHGRGFDRALLRWELEHFREWGLEELHGPLSPGDGVRLEQLLDRVADAVLALPTGFVHRDYQSRNLMWRTDGTLAVIDFQDALLGPRVYDLVALLCDSYVEVPLELRQAMVDRYARRRGLPRAAVQDETERVTVQRKLKDSGRFVYIDRVRGNPAFLPWYAPSLRYAAQALDALAIREAQGPWRELGELLSRHLPGYPGAVPTPPAATGSKIEKS